VKALRSTVLLLAFGAVGACQVAEDSFYATVFPCSIAAAANQCGTTKSGTPMVCYPGSQFGGGSDFCTEACDSTGGVVEPGYVCLNSGALLKSCMPDPPAGTPNGCPTGLNCYRTDIGSNQGVCLMMQVCTVDNDCTDSRRPRCAATLVHQIEPLITTDHLECVQPTCATSGSACQIGESCSADYYNTGQSVPDICLPNCLGSGECPPNYACARGPAAPGSPAVCIPGIPGERCDREEDCIWGDCLDTGAGFNECILPLPCTTDLDCAVLDAPNQTFACTANGCVGLTSFHGSNCMADADCQSGEQCFGYSPHGVTNGHGECRVACAADLTCATRGGVPQVCLEGGAGGCYPGEFGLPCTQSSECLSEFTCLTVSPDPRTVIDSPSICTTSCGTDDDCQSNPLIRSGGFCEDGLCRLTGVSGASCDRDTQCQNGLCLTGSTSGSGQCT
jgi:hypothetical protein